ncbi:MAG: hypothetical protein ACXVCV_03025 [Polyangia bacterium]
MRTLLTSSLLLITLAPVAAHATEMEEIPTPPGQATPQTTTPAAPPTVTTPTPPADPQAEWDHRFIAFEDWVAYNVHSGAIVNAWSKPVEGKYRKPLPYDEFYAKVGRPDLADRYRTRRNVKIGLGVTGALALIGGFVAIGAQFKSNSDAFSNCVDGNVFHGSGANCMDTGSGSDGYVAGGILLGVGFAGILAAIVTPAQPAQPYEAREMADQYNKKLRDELGLDRAPAAKPAAAPEGTSLTLAPSVDAKGAGLRLVARF